MPYISPTTNPAEALNGLGSAMFPDPSRMAAAQYQGAHARKAEAETSALNAQNIAKQSVGQALAAAVANPSQETVGNAVSIALQAGYDPAQVVRGALAAHQAAGSPGGPQMAQSLVDTIATTASGGNFASTPTGFNTAQQNDIKRAQIGIMPGMAQVGLNRDIANNNRVFVDQAGNRNVVPMGQPIPAGMMPEETSRAFGTANIGIQPGMERERRETQQYQDTPQPYVNPGSGQTFNRQPGGPMPPQGFLPAQQGAGVLSSTISSAPGMLTANQAKPYAVPGPGRTGMTTQYFRPGETPPPGAIPLDAQNPVQTGVGVGMFGQQGADPGVNSGGVTTRTGLGGLIAPAGGSPPAPAPASTAAPPAPPDAGGAGTQAPPAPRLSDTFDTLAATATTTGAGAQVDKPADDKTINTAIDRRVAEYNAEKNSGIGSIANKDFQLEGAARTALIARAAQLQRTRGPTFGNFTAALQQAWSELEPQFQRDTATAKMPTGPSLLRLPPKQGGGTGPVPSAGSPSSAPTGTTPTHQEPVPAPGNVARSGPSSPLSSTMIPSTEPGVLPVPMPGPAQVAPAGAQVAQAAPQQAPPPAPPSPAARAVGMVYTTPNGQQLMWTGQGWTR